MAERFGRLVEHSAAWERNSAVWRNHSAVWQNHLPVGRATRRLGRTILPNGRATRRSGKVIPPVGRVVRRSGRIILPSWQTPETHRKSSKPRLFDFRRPLPAVLWAKRDSWQWKPCYRGKAAEGRRSPKRWRAERRRLNGAKRLGVRQPSGALGGRLGHDTAGKTCRRRREESHSDGEENNESRHLDSYIKTRRGGDGGEGGSAVPAERSGRAAGGSADCPNPQRVDRQKRIRNSPMPLCLAKRCELGQLAV